MAYLKVNEDRITPESAEQLIGICPFSAISYEDGRLNINAACRMCRLCVKNGPPGCIVLVEEEDGTGALEKSLWKGIAVYVEHSTGVIHNVTLELIGKARELAKVTQHPVDAVMIGSNVAGQANEILKYGVDRVFVYDYPEFDEFKIDIFTNAFEDFVKKVKPSVVMVGATNLGRTLAPRVAARFRTGLTADCTVLEMKANTDLVQIRPAFGGNIMARIVTPNHRPQFCTVRYKIFSTPELVGKPAGKIVQMELPASERTSAIAILKRVKKPKEIDISEAEVIVAVGRGLKSRDDIPVIKKLAEYLGAQLACTRPLIECGWFDARHQIGLSGRTVKPKLIISIGISGAVQFVAGMRNSDTIVAINCDPAAPIFDIAHYGICGNLYKILPMLLDRIEGGGCNAVCKNEQR